MDRVNIMPKQLITLELERDNLQQKWGMTIQGGADLALTAKIASVKVSKIISLFLANYLHMIRVRTVVNCPELFVLSRDRRTNDQVTSQSN